MLFLCSVLCAGNRLVFRVLAKLGDSGECERKGLSSDLLTKASSNIFVDRC